MKQNPAGFSLGQRVLATGRITFRYRWDPYPCREQRCILTHSLETALEGLVIGVRHRHLGHREWLGEEDGTRFFPSRETVKVYQVVFDLRRTPLECLPEHLEAPAPRKKEPKYGWAVEVSPGVYMDSAIGRAGVTTNLISARWFRTRRGALQSLRMQRQGSGPITQGQPIEIVWDGHQAFRVEPDALGVAS